MALLIFLSLVVLYGEARFDEEFELSRPVTATPAIRRPPTTSCQVSLLANQPFFGTNAEFRGAYEPPPKCPPPWAAVVLDWNGRVEGRQIDRLASLWLGGGEIFRGSTPWTNHLGAMWHAEKDVSEYAALFLEPRLVLALLPSPQTFWLTSAIFVEASLTFYVENEVHKAPSSPDLVVPLSPSRDGSWFTLRNSTTIGTVEVTLPTNVVGAHLEVYATGHSCEEYWYAAAVAGCKGSTPLREIRVFVDDQLASVVWPSPLVYTGGCNPGLWRPIPAINAFNIPPYIVDLTPFAALLANGMPHKMTLQVLNNNDYWRVNGNLLLDRDPQEMTITGELTTHDIQSDIFRNETQRRDGTRILATIEARRALTLSGYTEGSSGRVTTTVRQNTTFSNKQRLEVVTLVGGVEQVGTVTTVRTIATATGLTTEVLKESYEIAASCNFQTQLLLPASFDLALYRNTTVEMDGVGMSDSWLSDVVHARTRNFLLNILAEDMTTEEVFYSDPNIPCYGGPSTDSFGCIKSVSQSRPNFDLVAVCLVLALAAPLLVKMTRDRREILAGLLFDAGLLTAALGVAFLISKIAYISDYGLAPAPFLAALSFELGLAVMGSSTADFWDRN